MQPWMLAVAVAAVVVTGLQWFRWWRRRRWWRRLEQQKQLQVRLGDGSNKSLGSGVTGKEVVIVVLGMLVVRTPPRVLRLGTARLPLQRRTWVPVSMEYKSAMESTRAAIECSTTVTTDTAQPCWGW